MKKGNSLDLWQTRFEKAKSSFSREREQMNWREQLYDGTHKITGANGKAGKDALHVRNIVAELIECQVSSTIPLPKVTAVREQDEWLAKKSKTGCAMN